MRPNPENRAKTVVLRACNTVLLAGLVAVLAGCGGARHAATTAPVTTAPVTTAPADPGKVAIDASRGRGAEGRRACDLGMLLSTQSRDRLGPTLGAVREGAGRGAAQRRRRVHALHEDDRLGADHARVRRRRDRRRPEREACRLRGSPASPGRRSGRSRPAARSWCGRSGPTPERDGAGRRPGRRRGHRAGRDRHGRHVPRRRRAEPAGPGTASNSTLFTNFDRPLDPGRHTVVVFASDGRRTAGADGLGFHAAAK